MKDAFVGDVVIIGGGMVGLALALMLAKNNFKLAIVDHKQPLLDWPQEPTARVSAINSASLNMLDELGVLENIGSDSMATLSRLFVWDGTGGGEIEFDSAELGIKELGRIIENRAIIKVLYKALQNFSNVSWFNQLNPVKLQATENEVTVELEDGQRLAAKLCVGADGANSWVRSHMQSSTQMRSYQQQAIIAVVQTEMPHQNTGWQVFLPQGPLALLPLSNPNQCAIVFSQKSERAQKLMQMDELEFECELNNEFGVRLGEIKFLTDRRCFPLTMRHVDSYVEPRLALVGDAAHTIHPLAGQGVNLGFADVVTLARILNESKAKDIGALKSLRKYARARRGDNAQMICAMRFFSDLFTSDSTAAIQLRSQGLNITNKLSPLKNYFMREALGAQL